MRTLVLALILGSALWTVSYADTPSAQSDVVQLVQDKSGPSDLAISPATGEGFKIIRGEVLKMEGNSYLVKDETGKEIRMTVDKDSKVDQAFQVGDMITAQVSDQGVITVITKSVEAPAKK